MYIDEFTETAAQAPAYAHGGKDPGAVANRVPIRTNRRCHAEPVAEVVAEFNSAVKIIASTISCQSQESSLSDLEPFRNV
jgi:hypothetical protein